MKIVEDLIQQGTSPSATLEIGVSKPLCNLCEVFMGLVKKAYPNITIVVSTHHGTGKNVPGWRLPPSTPAQISRVVEDHINSCIEEIRCKTTKERRADSEPCDQDSSYGGIRENTNAAKASLNFKFRGRPTSQFVATVQNT